MNAPSIGKKFEDFELAGFKSQVAREKGPYVLVVWRTGCPTCRLSVPYFDRLQKFFPEIEVIGISQDSTTVTTQYCQENQITFRQLSDEDNGMRLSRLWELDVVPSYWLVSTEGGILDEGTSWDKPKLNAIGDRLAQILGKVPTPVVTDDDPVPAFRPG